MQLDENSREKLADMIEGYIYDFLESKLNEEETAHWNTLKEEALQSINEWFFEGEDQLNEEVISDSLVIEDMVNTVFEDLMEACKSECDCGKPDCPLCNPKESKESCKKESDDEDDDDEKDSEDKDDDDEDDKDDVDEAALTKHHITKIQSVLDARKRATDPKYKMSRRRTLMKQAARGGRVINKKLSKSVKKSYRQGFGKRWEEAMENMEEACKKEACKKESDTEKDDVEGNDVKPKDSKEKAVKKIKSTVKVQKEAMEESVREALKDIPAFGTLNEEESASMTEAFMNLLSKHVDEATDSITEAVLNEMETYQNEVVIPEITEKANAYMAEEVIPSLEADVNDYLDYVVNEKIEEIMESGKIYKSRESIQLESFRDKLLDLIESDLQIVPEQEDALIAMESKCDSLSKSLQEARVEKIKARNRAIQLENELWIEKNIPSDVSEATSEKIRDMLEAIEADTHEAFVSKAEKIIEEATATKTPIKEEVVEQPKKQPEEEDIVSRTMKFMKR